PRARGPVPGREPGADAHRRACGVWSVVVRPGRDQHKRPDPVLAGRAEPARVRRGPCSGRLLQRRFPGVPRLEDGPDAPGRSLAREDVMIGPVLKFVWKRKRSNALLVFEIFVSFLVAFVVAALGAELFDNYTRPLGFRYEDVWTVTLSMEEATDDR